MVLAVVGSRKPTATQRERCQQAVEAALKAGWSVVTGGAPGIDCLAVLTAQKADRADHVTLVLPWQGFEGWQDQRLRTVVYDPEEHADWLASAKRHHPAPERVKESAWPLLARNVGIVRMADAVFAYPALVRGKHSGGTAHDIRVAQAFGKKLWVDDGRKPAGTPWRDALRLLPAEVAAATVRPGPEPHSREHTTVVDPELWEKDREAWMRQQRDAARAAREAAAVRRNHRDRGAPAAV